MIKVYEAARGHIKEFALVKETDKTFQVNFINDGIESTRSTRIQKTRDVFEPRLPRECWESIATLDRELAKTKAIEQLEGIVRYHKNSLYEHEELLKDVYADK